MVVVDRASWHSSSVDFPTGLTPNAGGTHIGLFFAWLIINDFVADQLASTPFQAAMLNNVEWRRMTGRECLFALRRGELWLEDVHHDVRPFVAGYYNSRNTSGQSYMDEYERTFNPGLPSIYNVDPGWDTYALLEPVLDAAYARWRRQGRGIRPPPRA